MSMFHHIQNHGKCSKIQKSFLKQPVDLLINIVIDNLL